MYTNVYKKYCFVIRLSGIRSTLQISIQSVQYCGLCIVMLLLIFGQANQNFYALANKHAVRTQKCSLYESRDLLWKSRPTAFFSWLLSDINLINKNLITCVYFSVHLIDIWNVIEAFRDHSLNTLEIESQLNVSRYHQPRRISNLKSGWAVWPCGKFILVLSIKQAITVIIGNT